MDPFKKFKKWFDLAKKTHPFDHTSFALSTVYKNKPYVRMILLKKILDDGFVFFTNINSAKCRHFEFNKNFSMCFYCESIEKQIRIVGKGRLVENKMSEEYFFSRQRGSKIGAWASDQSSEIPGEHHLENRQKYFINKFRNKEVPRPKYWVGIKVIPEEFEFWQRGKFRLHKREFYSLKNKKWEMKVLAP